MSTLTTLARDLAAYNSGILRARAAYAARPTACATWCRECIHPIEERRCEHCRDLMRGRGRKYGIGRCSTCPTPVTGRRRYCDTCKTERRRRRTHRARKDT